MEIFSQPILTSIYEYNKILYLGTQSGLFKSSDDGENWQLAGLGDQIIKKTLFSEYHMCLFSLTYSGLYKYYNSEWMKINFENDITDFGILSNGDIILCATTKIYKSSNEGLTWDLIYQSDYRLEAKMIVDSEDRIYMIATRYMLPTAQAHILYSFDYGVTWDKMLNTFLIGDIIVSSKDNLYVSFSDWGNSKNQCSNDKGVTWTDIGLPENRYDYCSFENLILAVSYNNVKLYYKEESQNDWFSTNTINSIRNPEIISYGREQDSIIVIVDINHKEIIRSTNLGKSWVSVYFETTSIKDELDLPSSNNLEQNYPNPFNPKTTIEYDVPNSCFVNISVYNSIGEKIETLVNEFKNKGKYTTKFYGKNLASGTYFYKLTTDEKSEIKIMQYMK